MGLYDDVLAQERDRVATEATALPAGSGSVYLAAKGGERMRQGARKMFGIEEPAVIAAKAQEAQQVQLQGIMSKYQTASTREEFTKAMNELMANGFDEQAAKVQEHIKNMPAVSKPTTSIEEFKFYQDNGGLDDYLTFMQKKKGKGDTTIINTGDKSSVGWESIDKAYGIEFLEWNRDSGDMIGQLAQLETVLTKLETPGADLTGAVVGLAPEWYTLLTNPDALDAKEKVAEVVQRNLKLILGGQFSEREGKQLIDRAYNPGLSEQQNISRLKRLIMQMQAGVDARNNMNAYFSKNGTLKGYEGKQVSKQSFYAAMEGIQQGDTRPDKKGIEWEFIGGDPALPGNWRKVEV